MVVHNFQEIEHGFCGNVVFNRFDVLDCTEGEDLDVMVERLYSQLGFNKLVVQLQQLAEHATTRFTEIKALAAIEKARTYHFWMLGLGWASINHPQVEQAFTITDLTL